MSRGDGRRLLDLLASESGGSDSRAAYRETCSRLLDDGDDLLVDALSNWTAFVRRHHGQVFADEHDEAGSDPRPTARDVFLDVLAYDFTVSRLLRAFERAFGVRLRESDPTATNDALAVALDDVHDRVVDANSAGSDTADSSNSDSGSTDSDSVAPCSSSSNSSVLDGTEFDTLRREDFLDADPVALGSHYERVVSRPARLALGEYYTPRGLAALALPDRTRDPDATVLDPACGAGVFLVTAIDAKRRALADGFDGLGGSPADVVDRITDSVVGIDLNPVAVRSAKLAYLLALAPLLADTSPDTRDDADRELALPVAFGDALALTDDEPVYDGEPFVPSADVVVSNPPWLTWDRLAPTVRARWRERYVADLDLLPVCGPDSLLGYTNDDLSVPFAWVCLHRYLGEGGEAGLVLKRGLLTGSAGRLFRQLRVGDRPLRLDRVEDFTGFQPFGEAGSDAAVYQLTADVTASQSTDSGVPLRRWQRRDGVMPDFGSPTAMTDSLATSETTLVPADPADPAGSWVRADAERRALGDCTHEIRHGVKDDAKDVFALDRAQLADLEPDHVFPYLKSRHIVKYGLFGYDLQLVPMRQAVEDNEAELADQCPRTYDYLREHRERLTGRSSTWFDRGPFYTLFGLGPYTWSDYKVVWCRLGFKPHFAVVSTVDDPDLGETPVVPGDHCMFLSIDDPDEAHFLCGLLNSAPYQRSLHDTAAGGKSALSKNVVSKLSLPQYTGTDRQRRLADLSKRAHDIVPQHTDVSKRTYNRTEIPALAAVQAEVDRLVEEWLTEQQNGNS